MFVCQIFRSFASSSRHGAPEQRGGERPAREEHAEAHQEREEGVVEEHAERDRVRAGAEDAVERGRDETVDDRRPAGPRVPRPSRRRARRPRQEKEDEARGPGA
jgi:hypothetical protein